MNWNWEVIWEYFPRLLQGALTTLELVFISGVAGLLLAVPLMTIIQVVLKQIPKLQPIYRVIAR